MLNHKLREPRKFICIEVAFKLLHARSKELSCLEFGVFFFFLTSDHGGAQYSVCQKLPQYDPALMPSELFNRIAVF